MHAVARFATGRAAAAAQNVESSPLPVHNPTTAAAVQRLRGRRRPLSIMSVGARFVIRRGAAVEENKEARRPPLNHPIT